MRARTTRSLAERVSRSLTAGAGTTGLVLVLTVSDGQAHSPSGANWTYPPACCNGDEADGDCQRIPTRTVRRGPDGFAVYLKPGDHPRVTHDNFYFVPYDATIPSEDGRYHICLYPTEEHENCFFAPPDLM